MRGKEEIGEVILGRYEATALLQEDPVYRWLACRDREATADVVLQVLRAGLSKHVVGALKEHFKTLDQGTSSRKKLVLPAEILTGPGQPLVLLYKDFPRLRLISALQAAPERALHLWEEAAECLHFLHNQKLVHGWVNPDCFLVAGESVRLGRLGFGPLLDQGQRALLGELGELLAPEIVQGQQATQESDIYGFAKSIAAWDNRYSSTDWYRKSTASDPADRYRRVRECVAELQNIEPKEQPVGGLAVCYILEVEPQPRDSGTVNGAGRYDEDDEVELSAVPTGGFEFLEWGGDLSGDANPIKILMDAPKKGIARFIPTVPSRCVLLVTAEPPEAGEIAGGGQYERGGRVVVEAKPYPGWLFRNWSGDLNGTVNPMSVEVSSDKAVIARFTKEDRPTQLVLEIRSDPPGAGDLFGGGEHLSGATVTVKATPRSGWSFCRWSGDLSGSANPTRIVMEATKRIVAHFEKEQLLELRLSSDPPTSGTVSGAGKYQKGIRAQVRARAAGLLWKFDGWDGDLSGSKNPNSVLMDGPKTVTARFSRCAVTVEIEVHPAGSGTAHGFGEYPKGQIVDIRAEPASGWRFDHWRGDLTGRRNPDTLTVNEDRRVIAHFVHAAKILLTVTPEPKEGGSVTGSGAYGKGRSVVVQAEPNRGWKFVSWSGVQVFMAKERSVPIVLDESKELVAHFEREDLRLPNDCAVKASAEPLEGGTITGSGRYPKGSVASLQALPNRGWEFAHWAGDLTGSSNPIRVTVGADRAVVAHFTRILPRKPSKPKMAKPISWLKTEFKPSSDPPEAGKVKGGGEYFQGETVAVTAEPRRDWRFDHWSGSLSGTKNPATVFIDERTTVTAHFVRKTTSPPRSRVPNWATEE